MRPWTRVLLRSALVLVGFELASLAAWRLVTGESFGYGDAAAERAGIAASRHDANGSAPKDDGPRSGDEAARRLMQRIRDQVLHPYVGFVFDPAFNTPQTLAELNGREITRFGFMGTGDLFEPGGPDRIVVGLTGGSVAAFFSMMGLETLVAELHASPELADKEIVFVTLALLGYKQPQQLFSLQYALTLGAHFDWVINLDGFNEIALPPVENVPKGVAAIYPRSWYWRVQDLPDGEARRWIGQVAYLEDRRAELARRSARGLLGWSVTANLLWKLRDRGLAAGIARAERALVELKPAEGATPFQASGPFRPYSDDGALLVDLVDIWRRSSRQMHLLSTANGIRYWHFLQPNQYVPGSKPMGADERALALSPGSPFRPWVEAAYPLLRQAGAELRAEGVSFVDLTDVFAEVEEPLYIDNCCHLGEAGNRLLARRIAAAILADLSPR